MHLFRAVRKLRKLLASERIAKKPQLSESDTQVPEAPAAQVGGMSQPHLSDDRLIEICFDLEVTSSDRAHLQLCPACEERRSSLAGTLDEIDTAATQEADAAFPADRLARQRARILQRVDQDGRPARVIAFPAGHAHDAGAAPVRACALGRGGRGSRGRRSSWDFWQNISRTTSRQSSVDTGLSATQTAVAATTHGVDAVVGRRVPRPGGDRRRRRRPGCAAAARRSDASCLGRSVIVERRPRRNLAMTQVPSSFAKASTSSTRSPHVLAESYHSDLVGDDQGSRLSDSSPAG